jgi:squalene-hopene/tetraprenyl-beta-curcumene cyclase
MIRSTEATSEHMKSNFHPRIALNGKSRDSFNAPSAGTLSALRLAIARTREWLLDRQHPDGHWVAELEGDTILESEYILLLAFLGQHTSDVARKAAQYILQKQMPEGGWTTHPGGAVDISVSVKAYFALKLTGYDPSSSVMQRARHAILSHGGADAVNSFTRFYLALLGQISYDQCPAVPPEAVLLPDWFPINLYRVSSWSRTIIVPLAIMWACKPVTKLDPELGISELFLKPPSQWPPLRCPGKPVPKGLLNWDRFFRGVDRAIKFVSRRRFWQPVRNKGLKAAEQWVIERFVGSEGLGAIFPPMVWSIIALKCLGYHDDSPELRYCHEHLQGLIIEQGDTVRLQPCKSPVWDTAITLRALSASGLTSEHPALQKTVAWLLDKEVTRLGDWARTVKAAPGGWCFEYANEFYPDVDDSIMVVMALHGQRQPHGGDGGTVQWVDQSRAGGLTEARRKLLGLDRTAGAIQRAVDWVLAMQNRDGGWGAFDRDNDHEFLCHVPFADHNAMIDPSTPDLTGRVLEMLGQLGRRVGDPVVDRAVAYIRKTQEADGSWFGRWGVNYIYGTWQALVGLAAVGVPADDPAMVRGANWLMAYQQPSGGWGETPDSYGKPHLRGQGPTTASQTAWAILGLLAAGRAQSVAVTRGINYLVENQLEDGTWHEPQFTGTGFPQVFYLRYHYYPIYFPLLALSQYAAACEDPAMDLARRAAFSNLGAERDG